MQWMVGSITDWLMSIFNTDQVIHWSIWFLQTYHNAFLIRGGEKSMRWREEAIHRRRVKRGIFGKGTEEELKLGEEGEFWNRGGLTKNKLKKPWTLKPGPYPDWTLVGPWNLVGPQTPDHGLEQIERKKGLVCISSCGMQPQPIRHLVFCNSSQIGNLNISPPNCMYLYTDQLFVFSAW